jgi:hypothetical protein
MVHRSQRPNRRKDQVCCRGLPACYGKIVELGRCGQRILTKEDNNIVDGVSLYPDGRQYVYREEVVGVVKVPIRTIDTLSLVLKEHAIAVCMVIVAT